jgi:hypothetical protein
MSSRTLPVLVGVALVLGSFVFAGGETVSKASERQKPKIHMLTPQKGAVFHPGDTVTITWEYVDANGRPPVNTSWCEQEIFLSLDGGRTNARRLTLALDPSARSFDWVVPNTPTDRAVLDIHYGCETSTSPAEVPNKQIQSQFRILPIDKNIGELSLNALPSSVRAGETLTLSWNSNVVDAGAYKVSVSYDRGGDFVDLATTNATAYTLTVPAQYAGSLTFRVSTTQRNGNVVESPITPTCTTIVRQQ